MALKKSQLYSSLWKSCDELRGGMDASQYKDYILTLLFMKYVSDKYGGRNAAIDVPEGGGFADMAALKGNPEIGDKINKIIAKFAEANDLKDVLHAVDFNDNTKLGDGKEMQDRLSKLIAIFETLDFRDNRAAGDDLLGDAYEYLMRHFATESGKSKGQFYTPAEVSRIMAKVVGVKHATNQEETIYDPTCGSGSLLLKAADEAPRGITIYGQEMDVSTWALAKMNMVLHDQPGGVIERGNTLSSPKFTHKDGSLRTFNYAVANPPFSSKAWSSGLDPLNDEYGRFVYGVPPTKNGDYAFLLHILASLKSKGKGAIILPHGVLFRGGAEAAIRRKLLSQGYIKGIIGLPANLFYGTGIPACIVVVDKEDANLRTGVFIVDASKGFVKDGNKNRLKTLGGEAVPDTDDERAALAHVSALIDAEATANRALKDAQSALDALVLKRYTTLTESDIKTLVIDDKWLTTIRARIESDLARLTQSLTHRIADLETRYDHSLSDLESSVSALTAKVNTHLTHMGLTLPSQLVPYPETTTSSTNGTHSSLLQQAL